MNAQQNSDQHEVDLEVATSAAAMKHSRQLDRRGHRQDQRQLEQDRRGQDQDQREHAIDVRERTVAAQEQASDQREIDAETTSWPDGGRTQH